jgi:hypothetical protein
VLPWKNPLMIGRNDFSRFVSPLQLQCTKQD